MFRLMPASSEERWFLTTESADLRVSVSDSGDMVGGCGREGSGGRVLDDPSL